MRRPETVCLLVALHLLAVATVAQADVFVLANGGRIEGAWLNPDESPRTSYQVETTFGGRLTIDKNQVERVVVKSEAERSYEAFLPKVPDTAAGHWDAAQRCQKADLDEQRDFHLQQVLRHEPDHAEARKALGYHQADGRWTRQEDVMTQRGWVRQGGAWRLPQEIELEKLANQQTQVTVEWRKKLRLWSEWIVKGRGKGPEGEAAIRAIREPEAAEALAEMLCDQKQPRPLRLLYLEILAQFPGLTTEAACTRVAIDDPDTAVSDRCLELLSERKSQYALRAFIALLKHTKNPVVHRAAYGLARLQDPAATLPLIDALITEHKDVEGGGGINPTFSNQGSGLSMGGGPKVVKRKLQNEPVLGALTTLYPGMNFQFDQAAWRRWYAEQSAPAIVSLRRRD
jgi:hypothetical protein